MQAEDLGSQCARGFHSQQKAELFREMQAVFEAEGIGRKRAIQRFSQSWGCCAKTAQRIWDARELWQSKAREEQRGRGRPGVKSGRRNGRPARRAAQRKVPKRQVGIRGYLGTTDFLREERQAVAAWGRAEVEKGQ